MRSWSATGRGGSSRRRASAVAGATAPSPCTSSRRRPAASRGWSSPPTASRPRCSTGSRRSARPAGSGASTKTALERLRLVFEEPPDRPLQRATIAGYEPAKAARFGAHTGMDPARPRRPGHRGAPNRMRARDAPAAKTIAAACALALAAGLHSGCGSTGAGRGRAGPRGLSLGLAGDRLQRLHHPAAQPADPARQRLLQGAAGEEGQGAVRRLPPGLQQRQEPQPTASHFTVMDNQGNEFHPDAAAARTTPSPTSRRASSRTSASPRRAASPSSGPTGGSMLVFKLPMSNTENRPLELEIKAPASIANPKPPKLTFTLDYLERRVEHHPRRRRRCCAARRPPARA